MVQRNPPQQFVLPQHVQTIQLEQRQLNQAVQLHTEAVNRLIESMQDRDLRMYKPGPIEPVAFAGDYIVTVIRESYDMYQVAFVEPLTISGPMEFNGGAVGASATLPSVGTNNIIDNNYGQLSILRFFVQDDISVQMFEPAGVGRHNKRVGLTDINPFTHLMNPYDEPSEFAVFEDQFPNVVIRNNRAVPLTQSRIVFYGIKYVLYGLYGAEGAGIGGHILPLKHFTDITQVRAAEEKPVIIPIGGWGR